MTRPLFSFVIAFTFLLAVCAGPASAYTPKSLPPPTKNVYQTIAASKKLEKFLKMIDEAGLKDMLSPASGEPVTVFAPDNEAIEKIPGDVMKRIEASKASLQSFVKYHVIAGSMVSSGAIKGRRASPASANGEALPFDGTDRTKAPKIGDGTLVQADIAATNGLVHIVDGPLVPPTLKAPPPPPPAPPAAKAAPVAAATPAASPAAATTSNEAAAATTSPAAASATTSAPAAAEPAPMPIKVTTSGVAQAPEAVPPKAKLSSGAPVAATGVAKAPKAAAATTSALPATTSSSGFELFGHKFSW